MGYYGKKYWIEKGGVKEFYFKFFKCKKKIRLIERGGFCR